MNQAAKRSLRARKTPTYLLPDNLDPDDMQFSRQLFSKEYISPAQELNNVAKMLAKFVNSANKHYRQTFINGLTQEKLTEKVGTLGMEKKQNKTEMTNEGANKNMISMENLKDDNAKKQQKMRNNQSQIQKKSMTKHSVIGGNIENKGINKVKNQRQKVSKQDKSEYLNLINKLDEEQKRILLMNMQEGKMNQALFQQQTILNSNPYLKNQYELMQQAQQKSNHQRQKPFGRSTYHVAIAYHIHLKQVKEQSSEIIKQRSVDPTYPARKIRQQQSLQERSRLTQQSSTL